MSRLSAKRGVALKENIVQISARPRVIDAVVASPTVPGAIENIKRVVDTVEAMYRRKQLADDKDKDELAVHNDRAYRAAIRLRNAFDILHSSVGGAMDFDRIKAPSCRPSMGPPLRYCDAAQTMSDAKLKVSTLEGRVLMVVVCEGHSLEECAQRIFKVVSRKEKEEIGRALRRALRALAERWFKDEAPRRHGVNSWRGSALSNITQSGVVEAGGTVTATRNRVQRN